MCIIRLFLDAPFPPAGKMEEKITWAPILIACTPRALQSSLILPRFQLAVSFVPTWESNSGQQSVLLMSCGTLLVTSQTLVPRRQHNSCASLSGRQMGTSDTHHKHLVFFLRCPLCAAGTVSPCRLCSWVFIAVKASYWVLVVMLEGGGWSGVLPLWVTRVRGASFSEVSATGPQFWNHLSISILAPLIPRSLLPVSCNSAIWHNRSSTYTKPVQVLTFSPGEGSGHSLQPTACTEVSFLTCPLFPCLFPCRLIRLTQESIISTAGVGPDFS